MKLKYTTKFKHILSKILPNSDRIRYISWLPKLNAFHKAHGSTAVIVRTRNELYDYLNSKINNAPIIYCEFGVYKGASIRYWSRLNTNEQSRFVGFDTFTGLPETWGNFTGGLEKGTFDTFGQIPDIKDSRVSFHKGLFQNTLPSFLEDFRSDNLLVINIDADLYSSTLYVLTMFHRLAKKGTVIIFDEFSSMLHEFRAFEDYCNAYNVKFEVLSYTKSEKTYYAHLAVRIL